MGGTHQLAGDERQPSPVSNKTYSFKPGRQQDVNIRTASVEEPMDKETFLSALQSKATTFNRAVSTETGDWIVKGFIDIARNIYTISVDTKVISKIMELLLFPELAHFAEEQNLKIVLAEQQNFYPDMSLVDDEGHRFALDIKSTYRDSPDRANGMTLGAFTGYFRDRQSNKNITFPYFTTGHFLSDG
jgi:hypothetical protein